MEAPQSLISAMHPIKDKRINAFDINAKYITEVKATTELTEALWRYAENFYEAAHLITEFILDEDDIAKLDTYFFVIAFLYRHCIELGLKAIGFQVIMTEEDRKIFVKDTKHNLSEILCTIKDKSDTQRLDKEIEWLEKYFADLSRIDRESDSFRYPFHIVKECDVTDFEMKYAVKRIFTDQIHIDLLKFANKFEAAFEIIKKWFSKDSTIATEWCDLKPIFIEEGGHYYAQSVVGYKFNRADFYPYSTAYLETANYLKWYMKHKTDEGEFNCPNSLFLPMCYLYRNCVELNLKTIWFEETGEEFQKKCKVMKKKKHSIEGMWNSIKPYALEGCQNTADEEYLEVIEDYCKQVHSLDTDASKFRYPMSKEMETYFAVDTKFDFVHVGDFFEELNNILGGIDGVLNHINEIKAEYRAEMMAEMEYY